MRWVTTRKPRVLWQEQCSQQAERTETKFIYIHIDLHMYRWNDGDDTIYQPCPQALRTDDANAGTPALWQFHTVIDVWGIEIKLLVTRTTSLSSISLPFSLPLALCLSIHLWCPTLLRSSLYATEFLLFSLSSKNAHWTSYWPSFELLAIIVTKNHAPLPFWSKVNGPDPYESLFLRLNVFFSLEFNIRYSRNVIMSFHLQKLIDSLTKFFSTLSTKISTFLMKHPTSSQMRRTVDTNELDDTGIFCRMTKKLKTRFCPKLSKFFLIYDQIYYLWVITIFQIF